MVILTERTHLLLTILDRIDWDDFQAVLLCLRRNVSHF